MGNFHCVPSSCAKVVYREYLPPMIRWRYPNENWQEIEGDDYIIENEVGACPVLYHAFGTFISKNLTRCNQVFYWKTKGGVDGSTVESYQPVVTDYNQWALPLKNNRFFPVREINNNFYNNRTFVNGGISINYAAPEQACINNTGYSGGHSLNLVEVLREDGQPDNCGDCTFKIFKNNQLVFERITDAEIGCPEVEKIPCRLSDEYKEITIDKLPYLERIEVVDYGYLEFGLNEYFYPLPDECLNIYRNNITAAIPPFNRLQSGFYVSHEYIAQICSSPKCPPPQYEVICDCNNCESCPDNSCAVECDGHICCYDTSTGVAIKQIAIEDYCGGHL